MSDDLLENKTSIKNEFGTGKAEDAAGQEPSGKNEAAPEKPYEPKDGLPVLFTPREFDIYINKVTLESYIFHGKVINYDIEYLEYNPDDFSVIVMMKDGTRYDLGARVQWMIRPYFEKLKEIGIVRTKDGESVDGTLAKIMHSNADKGA